jgi:hypothetical protein
MRTVLLASVLLLAGCVKPAEPIFKTVTVRDTVIVPEVRVDTMLVTKPADTITLFKDRLKVQIIRKHDTLRVSGECQTDTIYITKQVALPVQTITKKDPTPWWFMPLAVIVFLLTAIIWIKRLLSY